MHRMTTIILTLALLAALPTASAQADHEDPCRDEDGALVLQTQQTYVKASARKVGNLAGLGADSFPTWNTQAPAQDNVGGAYLGSRAGDFSATSQDPRAMATFEGTFAGCLDSIAVELYTDQGSEGVYDASSLRPYLTIDGKAVYACCSGSFGDRVTSGVNSANSATLRLRFVFTGLHARLLAAGLAPDGEHTVRLSVGTQFFNSTNTVFLYDRTDVPSGLSFNGATDGYAVLPANRP